MVSKVAVYPRMNMSIFSVDHTRLMETSPTATRSATGSTILVMDYRQQVILDSGEGISGILGTGIFTVMNLLTVTAAQTFEINEGYSLLG